MIKYLLAPVQRPSRDRPAEKREQIVSRRLHDIKMFERLGRLAPVLRRNVAQLFDDPPADDSDGSDEDVFMRG